LLGTALSDASKAADKITTCTSRTSELMLQERE
jgi:hypothetical protein